MNHKSARWKGVASEGKKKLGAVSLEWVLVLSVGLVWGHLGAILAQINVGIPPYLYDFFWCAAGAFLAQGFWQLARRVQWQVGLGVSGASGMLAGALGWLVDFLSGLAGHPLGQAGVFMLAIIIGALGIERVIVWLERLGGWWIKMRGN